MTTRAAAITASHWRAIIKCCDLAEFTINFYCNIWG